ncbi:MAG: sulfotransferase domain-containing protein [Chloroflexi bacterium]|nr:sulfotransferase domain-containing protein [Chloroflexota bacterium]
MAEILKQCAPERFVPARVNPAPTRLLFAGKLVRRTTRYQVFMDPNNQQMRVEPVLPGGIYGTVYTDREYFEHLVYNRIAPKTYLSELIHYPRRVVGNWWQFGVRKLPYKCFFVIRDLRDTMVSLYFSEKISHTLVHEGMKNFRDTLNHTSEEDGLIYLIKDRVQLAKIQTSWLGDINVLRFKYEELIKDPFSEFEKMINFCEINVGHEKLHDIISGNQFESASGRKRGEEDVTSHYRKGIVGDWKNHFTDRVKEEFKKKYGQVLIDTGYEKDLHW